MLNDDTRTRAGGCTLFIALIIAAFALFNYFGSTQKNPVTGETQHVSLTPTQEIQLGLQAAPQMEQEFGGLSKNERAQALVEKVGERIVERSDAQKTPYKYEFHVLADSSTINAFSLPGGPVFITMALLNKLRTQGQLAGVLGHEIGHVVARHGAEQLAQKQLTQGLVGAIGVASYDPNHPYSSQRTAALAAAIGQLINLKYSRKDELEADKLGVKFMSEAGYDPRAMIEVMKVLEAVGQKQGRTPEFFSTHPNPENRITRIKEDIQQLYPNGVPEGLQD
ncbi:MAG TPA: M48 family metallopeptidase [Chthonomonadaceae bacterium]|nr:M48 family metallopeptidase [Chthonomonadaceae bacterium]